MENDGFSDKHMINDRSNWIYILGFEIKFIFIEPNRIFNPYASGGLFGHYKMMQKNWKWLKTLAFEYSSQSTQQELSNEYQQDRV